MSKPTTHRHKPMTLASLTALLAVLGACASLPEARMRLPPGLAAAETIPVSGIGGGNRGTFSAGPFSGTFARDETRLAVFEPLFEQRRAAASFTLAGPQINGRIDADCRLQARTVTVDVVSIEAQPMAYHCSFQHEGRVLPARFDLWAVREGLGGMLQREARRGEIGLDGVVLQIRSVHDLEGSRLQIATPIGYLFELNGQPVAAVSLNGAPVVTIRLDADAGLRRTVMVAALALGLMRDPANSALGREAG